MSNRPIHSFQTALGLVSRGDVVQVLDTELLDVCRTLEAIGKGKATITLTLSLTCEGSMVTLNAAVKSKLPQSQQFASTPFWLAEGGLSTQHPSQQDMFPAAVPDRASR